MTLILLLNLQILILLKTKSVLKWEQIKEFHQWKNRDLL